MLCAAGHAAALAECTSVKVGLHAYGDRVGCDLAGFQTESGGGLQCTEYIYIYNIYIYIFI